MFEINLDFSHIFEALVYAILFVLVAMGCLLAGVRLGKKEEQNTANKTNKVQEKWKA